jgi:hypothetical protein
MRNTADVTGGKLIAVYLRYKCYKYFRRLLRYPWNKGKANLFFCPGHYTVHDMFLDTINYHWNNPRKAIQSVGYYCNVVSTFDMCSIQSFGLKCRRQKSGAAGD